MTASCEVLEPATWVSKELHILEHIDIGEQLRKGMWIVLLYHDDCPDCFEAIPRYEQMARDLKGNEEFLKIALVRFPPCRSDLVSANSPCVLGCMADTKEWLVTTAATVLLTDGQVAQAWEQEAPDLDQIIEAIGSL